MPDFDLLGDFYVPFIKIKFSNHKKYNFPKFIEKKDWRPTFVNHYTIPNPSKKQRKISSFNLKIDKKL